MGGHEPKTALKPRPDGCLPVPHPDLVHFSRCLRFAERDKYVQYASEDLRSQVSHLLSRVQHVRSRLDSRSDGGFWTGQLADHMADFRSKPQPRKSERTLATTLSRLHIGSRSSQVNVPDIRVGGATLASPNIAAVLESASLAAGLDPNENTYKGIQAGAVYFKDGEPYSHPKLHGSFPDQTTPLLDLLAKDGDKSMLMVPCEEGMLRWFHIPANNMSWVEEAIARHYNEERPVRGDLFEKPKRNPKTHDILRRAGWRGHSREGIDQHGAPHTRQLESGCEILKTGQGSPNAMCLVSPYLHWETAQGWERQNKSIEEATRSIILQNESATHVRDRVEDNFHNELRGHHINETSLSAVAHETIATSMNHFRSMAMRATTRRGVVGRILFCAARIAKLMASYEDDELVREYLYSSPPLHPRRTLHQSYNQYANFLRDTRKLDQDQIVYKATARTRDSSREGCSKWCQCADCTAERATVPRLLMVDQLWVFVLDENTIITSFPQRWDSYFSDDPSGVHTRIRNALRTGERDVGNPYDLVLAVFDVCCRVFYENITFEDRQPLLNHIFSDSINFVTTRELASRQELGALAQQIWTAYNSPDKAQIAEAHAAIMNINPEAGLVRQSDNILSDLGIIRKIKSIQREVLEQYHLNVARILVPSYGLRAGFEAPRTPALRDVKRMRAALDDDPNLPEAQKSAAHWTLEAADESEVFLSQQYRQIDGLYTAAAHCQKRLEDLLDTKSRYAGIISAWEAVANSVEQSNQGKSIMLFSVLSIIFLPLSFITSIFGMNIQDYRIGLGTLAAELYWVFGVSIVVIFFSLLLAFDKFSLALLLYCVNVPTKWVVTRLALYQPAALQRSANYRTLNERRVRKVRQMEDEIERARLVRETKLFWRTVEAEQARKRAGIGIGTQRRVESGNFEV
ncbi:hypothetical protein BT67DRAFT_261272 [Trichocladium antarcticum]|uniref:Uncharacterized protein n=1 Tax=Trichocladium antarcticum TaxID=1450529 RepID=A0AAN6ZE64_9PEZI|nr:hypothetical protein BT67DRAFT_261272 [Trichocladium antarcticum]